MKKPQDILSDYAVCPRCPMVTEVITSEQLLANHSDAEGNDCNAYLDRIKVSDATRPELMDLMRHIVVDGISYDGAHHKQYYLLLLAELLGLETEDEDWENVCPA